jgi:hypothetical protein
VVMVVIINYKRFSYCYANDRRYRFLCGPKKFEKCQINV